MERERQSRWEILGLILGFYQTIMHILEIDFEKKSSKLDGLIIYLKKRLRWFLVYEKNTIFEHKSNNKNFGYYSLKDITHSCGMSAWFASWIDDLFSYENSWIRTIIGLVRL